jgi:hypothetical protein
MISDGTSRNEFKAVISAVRVNAVIDRRNVNFADVIIDHFQTPKARVHEDDYSNVLNSGMEPGHRYVSL